MNGPCQIRVYDKQQLVYADEVDGPLVLGRQSDPREAPYTPRDAGGRRRVVIARIDEDTVSRQHVLIEPAGAERVRLTNLSRKLSVRLADGSEVPPEQSREVPLPAVWTLGQKTVHLEATGTTPDSLQSLGEATLAPGALLSASSPFHTLAQPGGLVEIEAVLRRLQTALDLLQSAATSEDFFAKAAQAVVELVGLDAGQVLLVEQGQWRVVARSASRPTAGETEGQPSRQVLDRVEQEKRTFWPTGGQPVGSVASLVGVKAVVAAPLLDRQGRVIGALYGDRRQGSAAVVSPLGKLEAMLVELLAGGVAAGLARLEQERAALAARIQFEQFFTPELSHHLAAHPDLLEGRDADVTVLFCDVRGFSRISERLGAALTLEWLRDVLGVLSDCVLDRQGVLVDYTGDELMAMWGAPEKQPDHARRACTAALAMLERVPELHARWRARVPEPLGLGIGIHTGVARVGNTGSHRKFKYGPHGTTVNLASRVQGATRYLKTAILITGATRAHLDESFVTRRLCMVGVVNIVEPVELHELTQGTVPGWPALKQAYETALAAFEQKAFRRAAAVLGPALTDNPEDGPSLVLLSRAVQAAVEETGESGPVWQLPGK